MSANPYQFDYYDPPDPLIWQTYHWVEDRTRKWHPKVDPSLYPSVEPDSRLCEPCSKIVTSTAPSLSWNGLVGHLDGQMPSLAASAMSCPMCRFLVINGADTQHDQGASYKLVRKAGHLNNLDLVQLDRNGDYLSHTSLWALERLDPLALGSNLGKDDRVVYATESIRGLRFAHASEDYLGSGRIVDQAMRWMDECHQKHSQCSEIRHTAPLPRRVLDISGDTPFLYESQPGEIMPYATLSYCWGKGVTLTTTSQNISNHRSGIPFSWLPLTIRQSTLFAKAIGFKYIWIDALCIIQDNEQDWAEQAARMTKIYQGCLLNIAVSDASSSDAGTSIAIDETSVFLGSSLESDGLRRKSIRLGVELHGNRLHSRGWTLQERLVSVATISITWKGLIWDCPSESFRNRQPRSNTDKQAWTNCLSGGLIRGEPLAKTNDFKVRKTLQGKYLDIWNIWLTEYSYRALTKPGDKLPAVAGLAAQLAMSSGMTYVAGLSREEIWSGLLWGAQKPGTLVRHKDRAPSWSWASVDGALYFKASYPREVGERYLGVISASVDEENPGTFGRVSGGYLHVETIMYEAMIDYSGLQRGTTTVACSAGEFLC